MLKRLFTAFLAAVMVMSLCVTVIAEEKPKGENIFGLWGDFENEEYWDGILTGKVRFPATVGAEASIADIGANGSSHSLKIVQESATKDFWLIKPAVAGETYDFSVMVKTDSDNVESFRIYNVCSSVGDIDLAWLVLPAMSITSKDGWVEYKTTFTVPYEHNGKRIPGDGKIQLRFDDGTENFVAYFDNLSMIPHGNVPDSDHGAANSGLVSFEEGDGVDVTLPAETADVRFGDIGSHWAKETIETLAKYSYVNGVSDTEFAPDSTLTRAQFVKMVTDLYDEEIAYNGEFSDVKDGQWFADSFAKAEKYGLLSDEMKKDGAISPDSAITREEAAYIASVSAKERGAKKKTSVSFSDIKDASDWAKDSVNEAASFGIINGYEDGKFLPKESLTRAEAAAILKRIVEVSERFEIFVDSEKGNDKNDGTQKSPLASIEAARDMAKTYAPKMRNDIKIRIRGEQYLEETFHLDDTDSGQNGYKIVYTSWGDEKTTLTMAKKYTGFKIHDKKNNIWKVDIGVGTYSRQAYFNDVPGTRARTVGYLENADYITRSHYLCDNFELLHTAYPQEIDMIFHMLYYSVVHKPDRIYEENGRVRIDMNDYFYTTYNRLDYYDGEKNTRRQTPSYLENAYEFLDQPGEWYLNKHKGYLYYIPHPGEDMKTMELKLPIGEEIINVTGTSYNKPASHIAFDNLTIEGTTWLRTEKLGGADFIQNNILHDKYSNTTGVTTDKWSVYFEDCRYIDITDCDFRHMGTAHASVYFNEGAKHVNIKGNEFYQLAGLALAVDCIQNTSYYNRSPASVCEYFVIENNYFHDTGMDFSGAAAVAFGHPRHMRFSYNEISNVPYSGIHVGWGWQQLAKTGTTLYDIEISYNYIHDVMKERVCDGAAIYLLGASSPECDMTPDAPNKGANKNRVIGNYLAHGWQCDYVYPDMGSTSWYVAENVAEQGLVLEHEGNFDRKVAPPEDHYWMHMHSNTIKWITAENNYSTSDYHPTLMNQQESSIEPVNLIKDGNWPAEARATIEKAGIQAEYRNKFKLDDAKILVCDDRLQSLELNKPTDSGLLVLGSYGKTYPISEYDIEFWCSEPGAVTIDENGMITAHKRGVYEVEAFVFVDGFWQSQHLMLECDDYVERVSLGRETLNIVEGQTVDIKVNAVLAFAGEVDITNEAKIDIKSNDDSVVNIRKSDDGKAFVATAAGKGETTISGTVEYKGETFELNLPAKIITYGTPEGATLPYTEVDFRTGWKNPGRVLADGGVTISGVPTHTMGIYEGLLAFDLVIEPGHGWPAIAFSDSDTMGDYRSNDCYMMGFREKYIEFQKFNMGVRSMIFGDTLEPIGGLGVPNTDNSLYEYGKRMSVVMGAINVDGGTRVVLNINGENVIDYMDMGEKAINARGYFVVYNPSPGGMTFYPYSGITE